MNDFDADMQEVQRLLIEISDSEKFIAKTKENLSVKLSAIKQNHEKTQKKFQWDGRWFLIKSRNGHNFITDFGDVEPGSWRKKIKKEEE